MARTDVVCNEGTTKMQVTMDEKEFDFMSIQVPCTYSAHIHTMAWIMMSLFFVARRRALITL